MIESFAKGNPELIARRYRAERRFRAYGIAALAVTALFLTLLIFDIAVKSLPAFREHHVALKVMLDGGKIDAKNPAKGDFEALAKDALRRAFPDVSARADRKKLGGLLSTGAADALRAMVLADPALIGTEVTVPLLLSDDADLYLKGFQTRSVVRPGTASLEIAGTGDAYAITGGTAGLAAGQIILAHNGALKITRVGGGPLSAEALIKPDATGSVPAGGWSVLNLETPESARRIDDRQAVWLENLKARGLVTASFATQFFTEGDSREPELAGIRGALTGSLLTVALTLLLALPIGVGAAIYLELFARKTWLTTLIEVNINNLAAVPSIIFGLLGLAVFLNIFGMPRSAPLVGGLVLALLVLPTIVITARAALKSVPPSIKEAALGVGASHQQAVFHHVLPLALPGILTGTILGVSRALGETAPLLMIGMVAFIADLPGGLTDAATVLPVQIFLWSDLPEAAFQSRTAAAIIVLLLVLFSLNAVAIYLRKRFERRW